MRVCVANSSGCSRGWTSSCGQPEPPARLHGDLWGGNLHVDEHGAPCLIDPAVYGGHREIDLAMMRLFGGFGARVFRAYEEAFPLSPGHAERVRSISSTRCSCTSISSAAATRLGRSRAVALSLTIMDRLDEVDRKLALEQRLTLHPQRAHASSLGRLASRSVKHDDSPKPQTAFAESLSGVALSIAEHFPENISGIWTFSRRT